MPHYSRRILILSNFFTEGHGGTPESILLLAGQLTLSGIRCDVLCNKGLCIDAGSRKSLPTTYEKGAFQSQNSLVMADYAAMFIAGSWNRRAPILALRAIISRLPIFYAAKGCLSHIEFSRLRDMRRVPYLFLIEWLLLLVARRIIFTSRVEMATCVIPALLWHSKAVLIPEPFEGGPVVPHPSSVMKIFGFLAEISPRKGLLELISGFGAFLRTNPRAPARLRIAGACRSGADAYLAQCQALAKSNGSDGHIEWLEPIRGAERDDFYASLDLFICPSQFESFGLTPLEALWQGTPVCAGPRLGVLEFLDEGVPVLRLKSLSESDIAEGLSAFVNSTDLRDSAREWAGRSACTPSNSNIATTFSEIFFSRTFHS